MEETEEVTGKHTPLPVTSNPATNAVNERGIRSLEQLAAHTEAEILSLHGVGPKAIRIWKEHMSKLGMAFRAHPEL